MLKSSLCGYSDAYILNKGRITITGVRDDAAERQADERNKDLIFKNCAPFINCKSEINNTEIDNAKDIDIVMSMYNLIKCSDNYSKTSESLWQYYKDEPNNNLADSDSIKSKIKIIVIIVPFKYLSNFWRALEIPLINCEVNLILTWSSTCVITNSTDAGAFTITDAKLYVPVVTLSTQDNAKLLQKLNSDFKSTTNWSKCQSDPKTYLQNWCLNHLVDRSFQGINRLFVLCFENEMVEHDIQIIIFQK